MAEAAPAGWDGDRMRRGMILRHLVLPGYLEASRAVLDFYNVHLRERALLSLMVQYIPPCPGAEPAGRLSESDYARLLDWLDELGIEEGFLQDLDAESPWIRTSPGRTRSRPASAAPSGTGAAWATGRNKDFAQRR